jgi:hypothetical protein
MVEAAPSPTHHPPTHHRSAPLPNPLHPKLLITTIATLVHGGDASITIYIALDLRHHHWSSLLVDAIAPSGRDTGQGLSSSDEGDTDRSLLRRLFVVEKVRSGCWWAVLPRTWPPSLLATRRPPLLLLPPSVPHSRSSPPVRLAAMLPPRVLSSPRIMYTCI